MEINEVKSVKRNGVVSAPAAARRENLNGLDQIRHGPVSAELDTVTTEL